MGAFDTFSPHSGVKARSGLSQEGKDVDMPALQRIPFPHLMLLFQMLQYIFKTVVL